MKALYVVAAFLHIAKISASPLSRRDDYLCAGIGCQSGTGSFMTTGDSGYPACSSLCFSQPDCKSFAWSSTECDLYNVPVANNYQSDGNSPFFFYDKECETAYQMCGASGYQETFDSYWWSNTFDLSTCASTCKTDNVCKSYAYGNGECSFYAEPVTGNLDGVNTGSPYVFYDVACPLPSSSDSSTTAALATAAEPTGTTTETSAVISPTNADTPSCTCATDETTTSTSASTSQIPSSTALCGLPGYESTPNILTTTNGDSYNDCLADCNAHPDCKAISFATSNNACNLYNVPASQASRYNTISAYHFYDADCTTAYKVCEVPAWDFQFQAYWDGGGYTADSCAAACVGDAACRSFAYGNGGECHMYFVPVTGNINSQPASPYLFSDATCVTTTG